MRFSRGKVRQKDAIFVATPAQYLACSAGHKVSAAGHGHAYGVSLFLIFYSSGLGAFI